MSAQEYDLNGKHQPKLSVEEAAEKHSNEKCDYNSSGWLSAFNGFLAGHTHATNDANLVPLEKVVEIMQNQLDEFKSDEKRFSNDLLAAKIFKSLATEISYLITQIKNLTKE